jgi:cell division septation protein DedD
MSKSQQDTEITLGTGHMLAIFFILVLVCAFFFATGFSLGRRTAVAGVVNPIGSSAGISATAVRPSPAKTDASQPQSADFSFYKAVGEKNADAALPAKNSKEPSAAAASNAATPAADSSASATPKTAADAASETPGAVGYYVQVAAVTRQEDAEALVDALKKKQYPAFTANNTAGDKFYHVQVGPYSEVKDAEAMRARLISDGYNPIMKK